MTTKLNSKNAIVSLRTIARKAHEEHRNATRLAGPERALHVLRRHHLLRELAGTVHRVDPRQEECALAIDALTSYESMVFADAKSAEAAALEASLGDRLERLSQTRAPRSARTKTVKTLARAS